MASSPENGLVAAALREHAWIRPTAAAVAAEQNVCHELDRCVLRGGNVVLHLLGGATNRARSTVADVSPGTLWAIVRPDIVGASSGDEFAQRVIDRVTVEDGEQFTRAVATWWHVYRVAAARFFEDRHRLAAYFADPATCPDWWNERSTAGAAHSEYASLLRSRIDTRGKDVLDAGCGFGRLGLLYEGTRRTVAVDLSEEMIRRARAAGHRLAVTHRVHDLCSVDELGRFDVVLALQVLMHASNLSRALTAVTAATRAGGEVWLDFTCTDRSTPSGYLQETFFTRLYSERRVRLACSRSGLVVRSATRFPCEGGKYWFLVRAEPSGRGLRARRARRRSVGTVSAPRG